MLNATENSVSTLVMFRKGRSNPISIDAISRETGLSPRQVKGVIESLRTTHRMPIGASREEPAGYFWIVDAEDQAAAARPYRNQILTMWKTLRVLDSRKRLRELLGQLKLEE